MKRCGNKAFSCRCKQVVDHIGPHVCACNGSWEYDQQGFKPLTMPNPTEFAHGRKYDYKRF